MMLAETSDDKKHEWHRKAAETLLLDLQNESELYGHFVVYALPAQSNVTLPVPSGKKHCTMK